jgi:hypothetical protein
MPASATPRDGQELLAWAKAFLGSAIYFWVLLPPGLGVSVKVISAGYQVLGAILAALGVGVISDWLARTAATVETKAIAARRAAGRRLSRWWEQRREQFQAWWARVRGRPRPAFIKLGTATARSGATANLTVEHQPAPRPDPSTISDREWLIRLEQDVVALLGAARQAEQARSAQEAKFQRSLRDQADDLRREIFQASRTGWPLVVAGLFFAGFGAALGAFA